VLEKQVQSLVLKAKVDNRVLFRIAEELVRKFVGQKKVKEKLSPYPQDQEEVPQVQVEVQAPIDDADLSVLRQAADGNDLEELVRMLSLLNVERTICDLNCDIHDDLCERMYGCFKARLHELAVIEEWNGNEGLVFRTLVRAVDRIGLYDRLMDEQKAFYVDCGIPLWCYFPDPSDPEREGLDEQFPDVVNVYSHINKSSLNKLERAIDDEDIKEVVNLISVFYYNGVNCLLPERLHEKIYIFLRRKLHILAEEEWLQNEYCVFMTLVRAVDRIGLYNRLMDEQKAFYVERNIKTCFFRIQNLFDYFDDFVSAGDNASSSDMPPPILPPIFESDNDC
jgi:hypothetical protein